MKNKVAHSIMFHHFHNKVHLPSQGSLSENDFREMLIWLQKNYSLIGAKDFIKRYESNKLSSSDICLSFDDGLKSQYDIALPVLGEFGIDAIFFIYSSIFADNPNFLEIYRYFRITEFPSIDNFYKDFFKLVKILNENEYIRHQYIYEELDYLSSFPFYSYNDKWFRYLRDQYLKPIKYNELMKILMNKKNFNIDKAKNNLWISLKELNVIHKEGHTIGLHSYTHPTKISSLSREDQEIEYQKNFDQLSKAIGCPIKVMSHPCGDYNKDTLDVLNSMGISIGFLSSMSNLYINSSLEIPREDHANIYRKMNF